MKVVTLPWLGKHRVYGIFMAPDRHKPDQRRAATSPLAGLRSDTGVLWSLINRLFGDLRRPCNWTLGFIERTR
jgi:hypothetical protein